MQADEGVVCEMPMRANEGGGGHWLAYVGKKPLFTSLDNSNWRMKFLLAKFPRYEVATVETQ